MSTFNPFQDLKEQLCYVQCSFCNTILLVSVPCNSLMMSVVTVRCGHCQGLLSVDLGREPSFVPQQFLASLHHSEDNMTKVKGGLESFSSNVNITDINGGDNKEDVDDDGEEEEEENIPMSTVVVNKPPEKRQRAPSAYNCFIKEEIKRIKAEHHNITHKEAFSSAAKNWAQFHRIQRKGDA